VAHSLVLKIYRVTDRFPKRELFGLISQMNRAAVSITSNISEGFGRKTYGDKYRFYSIARGSLHELENQLYIAQDLSYLRNEDLSEIAPLVASSHRLLNALLKATELHISDGKWKIENGNRR
jgi:four helix bundle protein